MYQKIINNFREGALLYKIDEIVPEDFIKNNPDLFEVYMLAKFCQSDNHTDTRKIQYEFDEKIKHKEAYRHFFFYKYCQKIKSEFRSKSGIPLTNHVPLDAQPVRLGQKKASDKDLFEVMKDNTRIAIIGGAGSGKTFSLEKVLVECTQDDSLIRAIPIYLELKGISVEGIDDCINKFLTNYSDKGAIKLGVIKEHFPQEFLLFLFDGVDEIVQVKSSDFQDKLNNLLSEFKSRFVITSRPLYYFRDDKVLGLETFKILELNPEQVTEIIVNYFNHVNQPEKIKFLTLHLDNNKRFADLATNPLLLTLICDTVRTNEKIPENEGKIYDYFINELEKRDRHREDAETYKLPFSEARRILENLAYEIYEKPYINRTRLIEVIKQETETLEASRVIDEIISRGFLRAVPGRITRYDFVHETWRVYFAACYLKRMDIKVFLQEKIKGIVDKEKWDEVLLILTGMVIDEEI